MALYVATTFQEVSMVPRVNENLTSYTTQFLLNVIFNSRPTSPRSKGSKGKSVVLNIQV